MNSLISYQGRDLSHQENRVDISSGKEKILVIDDDAMHRMLIRMNLEDIYEIFEAENGLDGLAQLAKNPGIRLVITDLAMPEMDGFALIQAIREKELQYTYIIVLSASGEDNSTFKALALGADDYLIKPAHPTELLLRIQGGKRLLLLEGHEELILAMVKLTGCRSDETGFHLERITHYTELLVFDIIQHSPQAGLTRSEADLIVKVSTLHDIGKIATPDNILLKPGKLTVEEFEVMKMHTTIGGSIIKDVYGKNRSPYLLYAYEIIMHHHEWWNGGGYPGGLAGNLIPLSARIVAVSDVYDAMTSNRCYKEAFSHEKAKALIQEKSGIHFDPLVVESFLRQETRWLSVKEQFKDRDQCEVQGAAS